jgi:hypothetical protein
MIKAADCNRCTLSLDIFYGSNGHALHPSFGATAGRSSV